MDIANSLGAQWISQRQSLLLLFITNCVCLRTHIQQCDKNNPRRYLSDEAECPSLQSRFLTHVHVPWGVPGRAWYTIPPEVTVRTSNIPKGGLGVFSQTFIKAHTWLDEYEGLIQVNDSDFSSYAWSGTINGHETHLVDAGNLATSNWPRWVNCALNPKQQNVNSIWCYGRIFYVTSRDIYPSEELLAYYGHDYAHILGINVSPFGGDPNDYDNEDDNEDDDEEEDDDDDDNDVDVKDTDGDKDIDEDIDDDEYDDDDECEAGDCDEDDQETVEIDEAIDKNNNKINNETSQKISNKDDS